MAECGNSFYAQVPSGRKKAGLDSTMDVYIQLPNESNKQLKSIQIMDVNGTDYLVEEVKKKLIVNGVQLHLAFRHEINGNIEKVAQGRKITDFMTNLTNPNCTIVFVDPKP